MSKDVQSRTYKIIVTDPLSALCYYCEAMDFAYILRKLLTLSATQSRPSVASTLVPVKLN